MKTNHKNWLETICDIANTYKISPKKTIDIYNKYQDKEYTVEVSQILGLTERYIRMNYPIRKSNLHFVAQQEYSFRREVKNDIL